MATRRDDDIPALGLDLLAQAVGIIGFVGENLFGLQAIDQVVGGCHIVLLPRSEIEANRQAERIDYSVDLGAEAAA